MECGWDWQILLTHIWQSQIEIDRKNLCDIVNGPRYFYLGRRVFALRANSVLAIEIWLTDEYHTYPWEMELATE